MNVLVAYKRQQTIATLLTREKANGEKTNVIKSKSGKIKE